MFKQYKFAWEDESGEKHTVDFYVHSKGTRRGFMHRACAIGPLPRLDEKGNDWLEYTANEDKLLSKRVAKVSYINRTWESFPGQNVLVKLWNQLNELKFVDMSQMSQENPFNRDEPEHKELWDPDRLFDRP